MEDRALIDRRRSPPLPPTARGARDGSAPGPSELPLSGITAKGDTVTFVLSGIPNAPTFEGKWDKAAQTIKGNVQSQKNSVPFELTRKGDAQVVVPKPNSPLPANLSGEWEGTVTAGSQKLRLVLALKPDPQGRAVATLASIDQNPQPIPVNSVTIEGEKVEFTIKLINGMFSGKANADATEISGTWHQGPNSLPLTFSRKGAAEAKK